MSLAKIARYPITIDGATVQIGTANELAIALDVLQGQHDRAALTQLRPHLAKIIANANGFMTIMRSLAADDQLYLIQALGPDLAGIMQDAVHLRDQLATMAEQKVEEALITTLGGEGLRALILTGDELAEVLEWVYGECDALVLDLIGEDAVQRLVRHASDLSAILHNLDFSLQARLLEQLGWPFVTDLVRDGRDLAYLLRALPPASSKQLLRHFDARQLRALIGNARDWAYLYQRLEPAEADYLMSILIQRSEGA
jgi:hypothetical protein